ncbi:MAG: hypothetical protein NVSMB25_22930 [Thermoleophilaceae bacterium]
MSPAEVAGAIAIGFSAGIASGGLGVGGGLIFVPGLVLLLGQSQLAAQSTSLLAIIPVALIGAWRQHSYGNLRLRAGIIVGALSPAGVLLGTLLANNVPERALKIAFAAVQIVFAYRLARRAIRAPASPSESPTAG